MPEADRSLVLRARTGDAAAYGALLARHQARLARVCRHGAGDPATAADLAQEAALVAWLQLDRLRDPAQFGPWLAGIGRVLCLRARRERAARREHLTAEGVVPYAPADARADPAERALARERAGELAAAIAALPPGQRDAVVLHHLGDLPPRTVAARLGTAAGAIGTRLHRARAALRARLTTTDPTEERPMPETPAVPAVPARIGDVRRTPAGRHVVVVAAGDTELPIWVGAPEAEALAAELERIPLPRPSTHALALALLRASGRTPAAVRIARLHEAIFYAEVVLDDGASVDARPSDALVLAVAAGVPISVDPGVLAAAAAPPADEYVDDLAAAEPGGAAVIAGELRAQLAERIEEIERIRRRA